MRIGKLRHRVTIEQVAETQDADGAGLETWSTYATVQASIEPISGREYFAAQSTQADVTHRIVLRYMAGIVPKLGVIISLPPFPWMLVCILLAVTSRSRSKLQLCKILNRG